MPPLVQNSDGNNNMPASAYCLLKSPTGPLAEFAGSSRRKIDKGVGISHVAHRRVDLHSA